MAEDEIKQTEKAIDDLRRIADDPNTTEKIRDMILEVVRKASEDLGRAKAAYG